jgi:hypothetical protein
MKNKGIQLGPVLVISLLFIGVIFVTGAEASRADYSVENFYLDEDMACNYAMKYLNEFAIDETPGLKDWNSAKLQKDPITVYDINGKKLFYTYTVTKDGKAIGEMEMAASKVLGRLLNRIIVTEPLDRDSMKQKAIEIAEKKYPGWEIRSAESVCYSYPKEGVMLTLVRPRTEKEKTVIIDTYTSSEVPLRQPKNEGDSGVWSLYDEIPVEKRVEMIENWNENRRKITTKRPSTMGISPKYITIMSSKKTLDVPFHCQEESNWCAAATGQMIAEYYGYTHTQSEVADYMGLDPGTGDGANKKDQLNYYKNGIDKSGSDEYKAEFSEAKEEIDADRPLKNGVSGHARCAVGYTDSSYLHCLLIYDPWPEDVGLKYWELYWGKKHTTDIHVED